MSGIEGGKKPSDLEKLLKAAMDERIDVGDLIPKERDISPAELEEANQFAPLTKDGNPLKAEGTSILSSEGKPLLTLPQPELVEALHAADARIESFDSRLLKLDTNGRLSVTTSNSEATYNTDISTPLAEQVLKDSPGEKMFPARGIAASINGPLYDGKALLVRDIRHILRLGDEKGSESTLMAGIGFNDENKPELHYRINQYLVHGQASLRERLPKGTSSSIFPVLLVYDKSKVKAMGGYDYVLPSDTAERSTCILKAYILPRPEF